MLRWYVTEDFFICEGQKPNPNSLMIEKRNAKLGKTGKSTGRISCRYNLIQLLNKLPQGNSLSLLLRWIASALASCSSMFFSRCGQWMPVTCASLLGMEGGAAAEKEFVVPQKVTT